MELNNTRDFEWNISNLAKIAPEEFEKYIKDWMERDEVAASLEAKLRSDLIKKFNKTYLGKHISSYTILSSGGSTMRLTLSPLVLALNTLVAEFIYAQNCHFTLSVFCTEIPFRTTLPDFERMPRFRFNNNEISDIWQALTGSKGSRRDLNKYIIQNYKSDHNMSLLFLIIKCLLEKNSWDRFIRNVEVQTEQQEKCHKSTSTRTSDYVKKSFKATAKCDHLDHINKYLLMLSEKVIEMTRSFEQLVKQKRQSRTHILRASRSRDYTLNKSLERLTENMKIMLKQERKNKHLASIVQSIDNLTHQFSKCAHNFNNISKFLRAKKDNNALQMPKIPKIRQRNNSMKTHLQEKNYSDWIHEMRSTENGQLFLNRVESSFRKVLRKHLEQLQTEADIKMKHFKNIMRLRYQQRRAKHALNKNKKNLEETRGWKNDNIKKKLKPFEKKKNLLWEKLHDHISELKKSQLNEKGNYIVMDPVKPNGKEDNESCKAEFQNPQTTDVQDKDDKAIIKSDLLPQQQIRDMIHVAGHERSVDCDIYDAKTRIQKLELESNKLDQNFQSYLERRRLSQEKFSHNQNMLKILSLLKELHHLTNSNLGQDQLKPANIDTENEGIDKEILRFQKRFKEIHEYVSNQQETVKRDSSTSSLEVKNAIIEAKFKFFEFENNKAQECKMYKCKEEEEEEEEEEKRIDTLMEKQCERYSEFREFSCYFNHNFQTESVNRSKNDFNTESSVSEISMRDQTKGQDINASPMTDYKLQKTSDKSPITLRRELFPKNIKLNEGNISKTKLSDQNLQNYLNCQGSKCVLNRNQKISTRRSTIVQNTMRKHGSTSKLISHSMVKLQELFKPQSIDQETVAEMVNELQYERDTQREASEMNSSTTHSTTGSTKESETVSHSNLNALSLSSETEDDSMDSSCKEIEMTEDIQELHWHPSATKELKGIPKMSPELTETNIQFELDNLNYSSKLSDLNLNISNNDNGVGEIFTETPIFNKLSESCSSRSSSNFEISISQPTKSFK